MDTCEHEWDTMKDQAGKFNFCTKCSARRRLKPEHTSVPEKIESEHKGWYHV